MDQLLTSKVKAFALAMGADLVGIANVERFDNAPLKMSPKGLLPTAKSVIVMAIHHPDAVIELCGEEHSQKMGAYRIQNTMNNKLDILSFRMARMLEDAGYPAVPIASSNIWRYRAYKDLNAVFAPDISHIYAAVAAGLGELGWNGLCMTPEFGARNRFVTVITEAELAPTPLYSGEKLCDMCGACIRACPTQAYSKQLGPVNNVVIDGKDHKFAGKSLWRCAWGEHFDVDLDLPIPDVVTEEIILDNIRKHGKRGGEMGVCLKVCLPKHLRYDDPAYCKVHRRKRLTLPQGGVNRALTDMMVQKAVANQIDEVRFLTDAQLKAAGFDMKATMPDARTGVLLLARYQLPETAAHLKRQYDQTARFNVEYASLDICGVVERAGYSVMPKHEYASDALLKGLGVEGTLQAELVLSSADFPAAVYANLLTGEKPDDLPARLFAFAKEMGADAIGVTDVARLQNAIDQIAALRSDETLLSVRDKNPSFTPFDPEVTPRKRDIRGPQDVLPSAKCVLVLGVKYPQAPVSRALQPPAEAVGPYVFVQYAVNRLIAHLGYGVVSWLQGRGMKAVYAYDLSGLGDEVCSPRGPFSGHTANAVEAVCAGLGTPLYSGMVHNKAEGPNRRYIAIVTDAELPVSPLNLFDPGCLACKACVGACPTGALCCAPKAVDFGGQTAEYMPVDANRCAWSSRYALCGQEGYAYIGSDTDVPAPDIITAAELARALPQTDVVLKHRPVITERCVIDCPLARGK